MSNQYIDLTKLVKSPLNVRKTASATADDELKASILAHGLMQNLVVTEGKKGKYLVIAGARRLEAMKALQAEEKLPDDHAVPCQVVSEEHAEEMSLAENVVRQAMHPADEHAAFAALIDGGKTVEEIAQRFGKTNKHVEQRLRLGRAAPELIQEYRDGKISLEALEAYTITDDRKRQMKIYKATKDGWQLNNPREIRALLTEKMVDAKGKLATFVGLETYEKAGGALRRDLFDEDVYLENPELLEALFEEKLKLTRQRLEDEGWQWVIVAAERDWNVIGSCKRLEPEPVDAPQELLDKKSKLEAKFEAANQAYDDYEGDDEEEQDKLLETYQELERQLDAINDELEALAVFTPEQMTVSGCYAYIGHDGELEIEKGLVRKEDAKKLPKAEAGKSDEGDESEPEEKPKGMPESLRRDLAAYRIAAAQAEIAKHPALAFDLLVFKAAMGLCSHDRAEGGPAVTFQREHMGLASGDARSFLREQQETLKEQIPLDWLDEESEAARFVAFQKLTDYQKQALLAYCVAVTLQPQLGAEGEPDSAFEIALAQTGANVATYWRPSATN